MKLSCENCNQREVGSNEGNEGIVGLERSKKSEPYCWEKVQCLIASSKIKFNVFLKYIHVSQQSSPEEPYEIYTSCSYYVPIALLSSCDSSTVNDEFCECECTLKDFANPF